MNKMCHILTMVYYLTLKRNEVLTPATMGINLENLSEINSHKKTMISFMWKSTIGKDIEIKSR